MSHCVLSLNTENKSVVWLLITQSLVYEVTFCRVAGHRKKENDFITAPPCLLWCIWIDEIKRTLPETNHFPCPRGISDLITRTLTSSYINRYWQGLPVGPGSGERRERYHGLWGGSCPGGAEDRQDGVSESWLRASGGMWVQRHRRS